MKMRYREDTIVIKRTYLLFAFLRDVRTGSRNVNVGLVEIHMEQILRSLRSTTAYSTRINNAECSA